MPNLQELEQALINADKAGDNDAARALVQEIDKLRAQPQTPGDASIGTAFKFGDLTAKANTMNYAADINDALNDGVVGDFTRFTRENIGNPVREFFGFDPLDTDAINAQQTEFQRRMAAQAQSQADALNYRSLTTDDVDGLGSAAQFAVQKTAESLPHMMTALAAPMMTPLLTGGEVNAGLKEIEGLSLDDRVALATGGGMIMALLENLGVGVVVKGMPKELVGKLGVEGVKDLLNKRGMTKVAGAFAAGMAAEGATETLQEGVKIGTEAVAGKEFAPGEIGSRLKESAAAGAAAGGTARATGVAAVEGSKAVVDKASNMDGLAVIHGGDTEALADVSRDIENLAAEYPDRTPTKKLEDAEQTLQDLHTQYMKQFDEAKRTAKAAGIDVQSADFRIAERRSKNKAKNEASNKDIDFLTQLDPELGAIARKMNVVTRFNQKGVKGGVSRLTDKFSMLEGLKNMGAQGRNYGAIQTTTAATLNFLTYGGATGLAAGGRVIDAATGSRNRVRKAINKFSQRPGIDTSGKGKVQAIQQQQAQEKAAQAAIDQQNAERQQANTQAQQAEKQAQALGNLKMGATPMPGSNAEGMMNMQTGLNRQQIGYVIRSLRRTRPDLVKVMDQYQEMLEGKRDTIGKDNEYFKLQDAIRKRAEQLGLEANTQPVAASSAASPSNIYNQPAYQAAVDNAQRAAMMAEQSAPTPAMAMVANEVAGLKTRPLKTARLEAAIEQFPEHAQYFEQFVRPLTNYGPEVKQEQETVQESRFEPTPALAKPNKPINDEQRAALIAEALGEEFAVQFNASDDAYYRRQELITLTSDGDKRKVLHEIFHAVENRLTPEEMSIIKGTDTYKDVVQEVDELYPELNSTARELEALAETAARMQASRGDMRIKYIMSRIKDLIEAFKNLIDGNGFRTVNSVLDEIYTGKTYQRQINEHYAQLYVPDIAYAKKDKPGGPMVAKRLKALYDIEEKAKSAKDRRAEVNMNFDAAVENIANNLGLPSITPQVLKETLAGITPSTDLGQVAANYLKAIGVMDQRGVANNVDPDADMNEVLGEYRNDFLALLKALQKAKIIGDFGLAFRTSAGGRMYPVHMLEPTLPALVEKAELNNVSKFENRATPSPVTGKPQINSHPLGAYDKTEAFIEREQKQGLVINDKIYEMMDKMQSTPQTHRGLDLIYKKDGTTDSAYTLSSAEALKQYKDNQNETGGMTPVFMRRRAQDRLRVDTLNGSASYQGKAGKAIWEFPNWTPFGETGFEQFMHALRDHFGVSNELPYSERVGFMFGSVGQYMELAGRPISDAIPQADLDMPLIDYLVNAYGQPGSYVYSHTRGGTAKLFLDKQSGTTLYQKNHAIFDVADHGFEIQRAAIELGRIRAFLENKIPNAKKIPTSELLMMPESQEALADFKSSYPVWFDGTSSSYQLHAVLTGDPNLAQETNLAQFDPDAAGGDLYRPGAEYLQRMLDLPQSKTRKITKKFISNRRSYGQVKLTAMKSGADEIAKSVPAFGERTETGQWPDQVKDDLRKIQNDLELEFDTKFPGAAMAEGTARAIAQTLYNMQGQDNFAVRVPLPDGDVAVYTGKLPDSAKKRVTWDLGKDKRIAIPVYQDKKAITGFAAFLNHSLDAYVQRELASRLRAAGATGFMHTHDAFATHAANGEMMRELYWQIVREIAGQPIYQNILKANGLNGNDMTVKYNIMTPQGSQTIEVPMMDLLQKIEEQKAMTFGGEAQPNMYALS